MSRIIVTIGPKSIDPGILTSLRRAGASSFRINLSHSNPTRLRSYFAAINQNGLMPSIDTQGAQLRVVNLPDLSRFDFGQNVRLVFGGNHSAGLSELTSHELPRIVFNHSEVFEQVETNDKLKIDFNGLVVSLIRVDIPGVWLGKVVAGGSVLSNRAVDIHGKSVKLAPLTTFDEESIEFAQAYGCREVYASFVSCAEDIEIIRRSLHHETKLISKIETARGVARALEIIEASDAILIDRGDLSREISIPSVPMAVKSILDIASSLSRPVYVATNILDSMMTSQIPSRAEISDIYTLLSFGVSGLVLAAEVAIGDNPVASTALLEYLIRVYSNHRVGLHGIGFVEKPDRALVGDQLYSWL